MNILIVTTIYPRDDVLKDTAATKVIHYFARQWKAMGHDIFVVHTTSRYFKLVHMLPQSLKDTIKAKTGNEIMDVNITKNCEYSYENIPVYRRPFLKCIPHALPSNKQVQNMCADIHAILQKNEFSPDLIVGHWSCPTLQILTGLGRFFSCKKSIVFHEMRYVQAMKEKLRDAVESIDAIGCRSLTLSKQYQKELGLKKTPFVCASGVPDEYLARLVVNTDKFNAPIRRFIYVGELINRKFCDIVIEALARVGADNWHLDVVGNGNKYESLVKQVSQLGVESHVTFHGRIPREKVIELMQQSQCFIMPSRGEAFGLVYLEAMATSCITIGSKDEGIDGIIEDRKNGLLVKAGSVDDLERAILTLNEMDSKTRKSIAQKGYETAENYSDSQVAERYLKAILEW